MGVRSRVWPVVLRLAPNVPVQFARGDCIGSSVEGMACGAETGAERPGAIALGAIALGVRSRVWPVVLRQAPNSRGLTRLHS